MFRNTPPLPLFDTQKEYDMYYYNIPNSAEYIKFLKKQNSLELRNPVFMRPTPRKNIETIFSSLRKWWKKLTKRNVKVKNTTRRSRKFYNVDNTTSEQIKKKQGLKSMPSISEKDHYWIYNPNMNLNILDTLEDETDEEERREERRDVKPPQSTIKSTKNSNSWEL